MVKIAYLGPSATFTEKAAKLMNADVTDAEWIEKGSIDEVIESVAQGESERGVVPLRTHYGDVYETLDKMHEVISRSETGEAKRLYITGYGELPIHFYLASKQGVNLGDIRVIATKQQAIEACKKELKRLLGTYAVQHLASTALGAKMVADSIEKNVATLCSEDALTEYNLVSLLAEPISKVTAFIRVGTAPENMGRTVETAVMIRLYGDKPGQLHSITGAVLPVNMTDIHLMKNKEDSYGVAGAVFIMRLAANYEWAEKVIGSLRAELNKESHSCGIPPSRMDNLGTYPIMRL